MLSKINVEDASYLADTFSVKPDKNHHSQSGTPIKIKLLFLVPTSEEDSTHDSESSCKLISVRVPKGTPIYRLRDLIKFVERELKDIYREVKRVNFILKAEEFSETWIAAYDLPMYEVVYV